jgi:hypothetical protein
MTTYYPGAMTASCRSWSERVIVALPEPHALANRSDLESAPQEAKRFVRNAVIIAVWATC